MSDLAAARSAQKSDFAHTEGRKIVVEHEALERLPFEHVEALHILGGPERGSD